MYLDIGFGVNRIRETRELNNTAELRGEILSRCVASCCPLEILLNLITAIRILLLQLTDAERVINIDSRLCPV